MDKKPIAMLTKDASDAAKRLNEFVENGAFNFDIGIMDEYVTTVTKKSDGTTEKTKEKHFRITGFADVYVGEELDSLNAVREDLKQVKKEREAMDRTLKIMNKSPFAPISILLLCVAIITLSLGILTLAKVLPLPAAQVPIAVVLTVVGVLALGGSIALAVVRKKKKDELLSRKGEILEQDDLLKQKEREIDNRVPQWYKDALWTGSGEVLKNSRQQFILKK